MAHKHSVYDTDPHFFIDAATRTLRSDGATKSYVIQNDHNSERITFEIPRYFEEHDMSQCNVVQVHYNNIDAQTKEQNKGFTTITDMQVFPEDDSVVVLSWLIPCHATKFVGSLNFLIRFACIEEDGAVNYVWNTSIYSGISVSSGIYNGDAVVEEYIDVLQKWEQEIQDNRIVSITQHTQGTTLPGGSGISLPENTSGAYQTIEITLGNGKSYGFRVYNGEKGEPLTVEDMKSQKLADTYNGFLTIPDESVIPQGKGYLAGIKWDGTVIYWEGTMSAPKYMKVPIYDTNNCIASSTPVKDNHVVTLGYFNEHKNDGALTSVSFPAPSKNTSKKLTKDGYYYIIAEVASGAGGTSTEVLHFGVVRFKAKEDIVEMYRTDKYGIINWLEVSPEGFLMLYHKDNAEDDPLDITATTTFYTAKIG